MSPRRGKPTYEELQEENKRLREEIVKEKKRAKRRDKYKNVKPLKHTPDDSNVCENCGNDTLTVLDFNFPTHTLIVTTCESCGDKQRLKVDKNDKEK